MKMKNQTTRITVEYVGKTDEHVLRLYKWSQILRKWVLNKIYFEHEFDFYPLCYNVYRGN